MTFGNRENLARRRGQQAKWLAAFVIGLLLFAGLAYRFIVYDPTRWAYRFHQRELAALVAKIKAMPIPINDERSHIFRVAPSLDPNTLRPYDKNADDIINNVSVLRRGKDDYLISIAIDDEGHFGTFGLIYSDSPLHTAVDPGYPEYAHVTDAVLRFTAIKARLGTYWWYGYEDG